MKKSAKKPKRIVFSLANKIAYQVKWKTKRRAEKMKPAYVDTNGRKYAIGVNKNIYYICIAEPGPIATYRPHPILPHMYDRDLAVEMLEAYAARRGLRKVMTSEM